MKILKEKGEKQTVVLRLDNLSKTQVERLGQFIKRIGEDWQQKPKEEELNNLIRVTKETLEIY